MDSSCPSMVCRKKHHMCLTLHFARRSFACINTLLYNPNTSSKLAAGAALTAQEKG